jgi:two-component system cell cycle sensor histidine kinase/response regulator CckA
MGNTQGGTDGAHRAPGDGVFDTLGIALAEIESTGATRRLNARMRALLDVAEGVLPDNLCSFLPAASARALKHTLVCVMGGASCEQDTELVLSSGRRVPIRLSFSPYTANGAACVLVAAIPLEAYREAAVAAHTRQNEARRLESLGMMAGGIAHDFNNLLVGVVGGLSLAESDLPLDSGAREHLRLVARTAQRMEALTQQMLAFSGHGHVTMEAVDLSALVAEQRARLEDLALEHRCRLRLMTSRNLPLVMGDRFQLAQVLFGLVANACEAMEPAGGEVVVRTRVVTMRQHELARYLPPEPRSDGEYVVLEVMDDGPGVKADVREKIFDPFYTTHEPGRGLGLAAAMGIVRGHRGFIGMDGGSGGGAIFRVGLPARTEGRISTLLDDSGADEMTPGTGVVLIVDDEAMVRHVARSILVRAGYEVIEAADGIEAIELAEANAARVSLVVLDLSMPRMGGREAFAELRGRYPHLPVLLMSGYPEAEACVGFRRRDLAGFLQKPFRAETLRKAVEEIVPVL